MCGFSFYYLKGMPAKFDYLGRFEKHIKNRGPDNTGYERIGDSCFIHCRLSIQDLSNLSNQPMRSNCGRYTLIYNGEIFNCNEYRNILERDYNVKFSSTGDTEFLLNSLINFGVKKTLSLLNGFYAFLLFDHDLNKITIARDPLGVKPLYYSVSNKNEILISSSLNSFKELKKTPKLDMQAVKKYLVYGYFISPETPLLNIFKQKPGHYSIFDLKSGNLQDFCFFDSIDCNNQQLSQSEIEGLLLDSVKSRLISDVPIGLLLSGGIDSNVIATLCSQHLNTKPSCYTLTSEGGHLELDGARTGASINQLDLREIVIDPDKASEWLIKLPQVYDEPIADLSCLTTTAIYSQIDGEKVVLGGDGADELFFGYKRYHVAAKILMINRILPDFLKIIVGPCIGFLSKFFPNPDTIRKLRGLLCKKEVDFTNLISIFSPQELNFDNEPINTIEELVLWDVFNYLPDDIFMKVDRASMYYGIESREPLASIDLVKNVVLNFRFESHSAGGKKSLRDFLLCNGYSDNFFSKKTGFSFPILSWGYEFFDISPEELRLELSSYGVSELIPNASWENLQRRDKGSLNRMYSLYVLLQWLRSWRVLGV